MWLGIVLTYSVLFYLHFALDTERVLRDVASIIDIFVSRNRKNKIFILFVCVYIVFQGNVNEKDRFCICLCMGKKKLLENIVKMFLI